MRFIQQLIFKKYKIENVNTICIYIFCFIIGILYNKIYVKNSEKCRKKFIDNEKFGCDNNIVIYNIGEKIET